jgi:hypothetical protein
MEHGKTYCKIVFAGFRWTEIKAIKNPQMTRAIMKAQRDLFKAKLALPDTKFATEEDAQAVWNKLTAHQRKWSYVTSITPIYGIL